MIIHILNRKNTCGGPNLTSKRRYGKEYIRPSAAGELGLAFPRRARGYISADMGLEGPILSVEELKAAFSSNDWKRMLDAANMLGKHAATTDDADALSYVVLYCEDKSARGIAMARLAAEIHVVSDHRVLEAIALNADEENDKRNAVRALAAKASDERFSFTLAYVAIKCRHESTRTAAVNCLEMRLEELALVAKNSEFQATREYAQSKIPKNEAATKA